MTEAYRITLHAARRIRQRRFTVEELLAALEGRQVKQINGLTVLVDPSSRCALVVDPKQMLIVTALRLRPSKYKRFFARERQRKGV